MANAHHPPVSRQLSTDRTETFSDGVFAIAITLLVLTIEPPRTGDVDATHSLTAALLHDWPSYLAYLVAFLTIGVTWMNHHAAFAKILTIDSALQWWNLSLLLIVAIAPFPTTLVADYLSESLTNGSARVATFVFILVSGLRPVLWACIWLHLIRRPELLDDSITASHSWLEVRRALIGVVLSSASALIALIAPVVGLAIFLSTALFYAVTARGEHSSAHTGQWRE